MYKNNKMNIIVIIYKNNISKINNNYKERSRISCQTRMHIKIIFNSLQMLKMKNKKKLNNYKILIKIIILWNKIMKVEIIRILEKIS